MKTTLPSAITTEEQAKDFLRRLCENNEVFHPEDNAHDIIWNVKKPPTYEECEKLNDLIGQIYALNSFDPCEYILQLI